MAIIKKTDNTGATRTHIHFWKCKSVESLWTNIWQYLLNEAMYILQLSKAPPDYMPMRNECLCPAKVMYKNVHSS